MKVLIVEDDSEKLRKVASVVKSCDRGDIEISTAHNAVQAKQALLSVKFDLLILDIALPTTADVEASVNGGLELLRTISRGERYKKPRSIIGLTAYEHAMSEAGSDFERELWTLVYFDRSSEEWCSQIDRKIEYLRVSDEAETEQDYNAELCVITALHKPEFAAIRRLPWNWSKLPMLGDATAYWEGYFERDEMRHRVVAACAAKMGMTHSATLATKMIHRFRPRYIAMTGIAAGIKGRCALGDAIVADPCWDWGSGKFKESEGETIFESAPEQLPLDSFIRSRLLELSEDNVGLEEIRNGWLADEIGTVLRVHIGPLASGAAVLADRDHAIMIKQQHRKVVGIDMEAYAIFAAAEQASSPRPLPFVIKGVVDFANPRKNDQYQKYAAYVSAELLRSMMEKH